MDNNNYNNEKKVEKLFKQSSFCHSCAENLVFDDDGWSVVNWTFSVQQVVTG